MCLCHKQGQQHPGLHQAECCQQVKGCDPSPPLSTGEWVLCPALSSPEHERPEYTGISQIRGHRDDAWTGVSDRAETKEEKAWGISLMCINT